MMKYDLSVCIPAYNSSATIEKLVEAVSAELKDLSFEIIIVNDCSRDNTEQICRNLSSRLSHIKFYSFRKNFGENSAVMCALNAVEGKYAVIIDDDFQNPPAEIKKLYKEIYKGHDLVFSRYPQKNHGMMRNFLSWTNNLVLTYLLKKPYDLYFSTFIIMNKAIVDEVVKYKGPFPYIQGLALRATDNISQVNVEHHTRAAGSSNYNLKRLFNLWLNILINFSTTPFRLMIKTGLILSILSLLALGFLQSERVIGVAGLLASVQFIFLGVLGEYLGRLYMENNQTPQYVVKSFE